jgi:hypothetical protein
MRSSGRDGLHELPRSWVWVYWTTLVLGVGLALFGFFLMVFPQEETSPWAELLLGGFAVGVVFGVRYGNSTARSVATTSEGIEARTLNGKTHVLRWLDVGTVKRYEGNPEQGLAVVMLVPSRHGREQVGPTIRINTALSNFNDLVHDVDTHTSHAPREESRLWERW